MAEANFDLGVMIADFESEFGFLFSASESTDIMNQTILDHGEDFDLEKFLEKELGEILLKAKEPELVVLSDDSDHDQSATEKTILDLDHLPDLDM